VALFNCTSLRRATLATSVGNPFGTRRCWKINAAGAPRKLLIIGEYVSCHDTKCNLLQPALAGRLPLRAGIDAIASARTAALADPDGDTLTRCLAEIEQHASLSIAAE
jgi:hypothetical protein